MCIGRFGTSVRAVTFDVSVPRYLLAKSLGAVTNHVVFGAASGLRMRDVSLPALPGPHWVELDVVRAGICGTDVGTLTFDASPILEPFGSFPAVLGHEILARVRTVGAAVRSVAPGQRVAVDPLVSCQVRGYAESDWCRACTDGRAALCHRAGEPGPQAVGGRPLRPGITIGYHGDLPGGWGERLLAHETQLHAVPDTIDDRTGVLVEPLAVGVHGVLRAMPDRDAPVLVIGSGAIALGTVWALHALGHRGGIVLQAKRARERELGARLGAGEVVAPSEAPAALSATGAKAYTPMVGPTVFAGGGFPLVFDCVGSRASLDQALRYASAGGSVTMLGCAAVVRRLDLTLLWARELSLRGAVGYGREQWHGRAMHTFALTLELLQATDAPVAEIVTHSYPLDRYRTALASARHHKDSGAIKVVLTPPEARRAP
jgi:threonine dehydrogenase-like Zn-dependent dehydrogenase